MEFKNCLKEKQLDVLEKGLSEMKETLSEISNALIGSRINGNKGIISDIDDIKHDLELMREKLEFMELDMAKKSVYIGQLKFVAGILTAGLIGTIVKILSK